MPEGDTVHKVAAVLAAELEGRQLAQVRLRGVFRAEALAGSTVRSVEALGKHLLVSLEGDPVIRVHLGMRGAWHRYRPGEKWKRSAHGASAVLSTDRTVLVCFEAAEVELFSARRRRWHEQLARLGPDLLGSEPDYTLVVQSARGHDRRVGELLLDQRVAAGLGNVYKSEVSFLGPLEEGADAFKPGPAVSPWAPVGELDDDQIAGLYRRGRVLLQANLGGWERTTTVDRRRFAKPACSFWVYGRDGRPCLVCGGFIEKGYQGLASRVTYWCPNCQASRHNQPAAAPASAQAETPST